MNKNSILVTGGAGYIGSHTVRLLADKGYSIIVLDNLSYGHPEAIISPGVKLIIGDIGDASITEEIFSEHKIEAVIHFAAYAYVGESVTEPSKYYHNNIAAPLNLLDTMRKYGCQKFIFSSTCATYGNPEYIPIDEKHPQNPINPYGKSKLMLETIIKDYELAYKIQYIFLRYFNASGASPDALIGEDHDPETHLLPLILEAAVGDRKHISVYGTDYPTPDGTCIRDYIHVCDLADAHLKALEHLLQNKGSAICNLGTGNGVSVKEVIAIVEKVTGLPVTVQYEERRPGDPSELVSDPKKALEILGWKAQYKNIEEIIQTAWNWKKSLSKGHYKNLSSLNNTSDNKTKKVV